MTSNRRTLSVALAGLLVLSNLAVAGAATSVAGNVAANDSLEVGVEDAGNDGATVTVTRDESAVPNATVTVNVTDDNATYAGTGTYETDASGAVALPEPAENVTVAVTAAKGNLTGEATATLTTPGESEDDEKTFGDAVSSFVHRLLNGNGDESVGQAVSAFVTSNNPGNADEKRPDHAGEPDAGTDEGESENAGSHNGTDDGSQGPPEHAGGESDAEDGGETSDGKDGDRRDNGKGKSNGKSKGR